MFGQLTETKEAIAQMLVKNPVLTVNIICDDYAKSTSVDQWSNIAHQATDHSVRPSLFRKILNDPSLNRHLLLEASSRPTEKIE